MCYTQTVTEWPDARQQIHITISPKTAVICGPHGKEAGILVNNVYKVIGREHHLQYHMQSFLEFLLGLFNNESYRVKHRANGL